MLRGSSQMEDQQPRSGNRSLSFPGPGSCVGLDHVPILSKLSTPRLQSGRSTHLPPEVTGSVKREQLDKTPFLPPDSTMTIKRILEMLSQIAWGLLAL